MSNDKKIKFNEERIIDVKLDIKPTQDVFKDIESIIKNSETVVYRAIDLVLLKRNWLIGKRIYEEELKETRKENYGLEIIKRLSAQLVINFGKGFDTKSLYRYVQFYTLYKNIFATLSRQSFLSWSHYRLLVAIEDKNCRDWYEQEALTCSWSVRTLQRNIESQYYYRTLAYQGKELIKEKKIDPVSEEKIKQLEHVKNPLVLEFLHFSKEKKYLESDIETAIINNLQKTLMELGKGYAFVDRQYHIHTEKRDYYIDLVFYNYILKCFVLIDLKSGKIEHQDIGQMDMYVRMFDELIKSENDNPTLGIVLCSDTDEDIARYSILKGNEQLFASKYKLYLPDEKELKAEIEYQKELFYLKSNH